jgi:hypothetical protein
LAATTTVFLENSAKDIAAEVNDECVVTPKNLRGIFLLGDKQDHKNIEHKVASLQVKLDKQGRKPGAANATEKNSKGKKDFCLSGDTSTTNSAPKKRNGAGRPGYVTSSTA